MKALWTLVKIAIALVIGIPLLIVAGALTLGILGTLFGLALFVLKIGLLALIGYGALRLAFSLFGGSKPKPIPPALPPQRVDPHYEAAMRELDRELGN